MLLFVPYIVLAILGLYVVLRRLRSKSAPDQISARGCCLGLGVGFLTLFLVFGVALGPIGPGIQQARQSAAMQTCRTIAIAMFQYSNDNDGRYPDGKRSTEVFQKLVDGNYVTDPALFFVPLPGKVKATSNKLKPENVAYDVTSGVDGNSPDGVPVVFLTGFHIDYRAGGSAVSLVKPFPQTASSISSWLPWGGAESPTQFDGLPIAYKSNNAYFRSLSHMPSPIQYTPDGYGIVPNILPPDFDAHGQSYHQLTPVGVLN